MSKGKIKNLIKKPYYYVPPCPSCGSHVTGRFVRMRGQNDNDWMINEALKNGELISLVPEVLNKTAYCVECDYTWYTDIQLKFLNNEQIKEQKTERYTNEALTMRMNALAEEKKKKKGLISRLIKR